MKHLFLLLSIISIFSFAGFGQAIEAEPNDTLFITENATSMSADFISKGGVINNTDSTINLKWRLVSNTSRAEWVVAYCDNNACIDLNLLDQSNYPLNSGDTGLSKIQISPKCLPGSSVVAIESWIDGARATTSIMTYYIVNVTSSCGVSVQSVDSETFSVYPNPASQGLIINDSKSNSHAYEVCDLSGRVVVKTELGATNSISVSNFENGVYFIRVLDETNKLLTLRKFVVSH